MHFRLSNASGFTLMELLVVFVLMSLVATLLIQGLGFTLSLRERVVREVADQRLGDLRAAWFREILGGLVSAEAPQEVFRGSFDRLSGLSVMALHSPPGVPTTFQLVIDSNNDGASLRYLAKDLDWSIASWKDEAPEFRYLHADRGWLDSWPPAEQLGLQDFPRGSLPDAVKLLQVDNAHLIWLAVTLGQRYPSKDGSWADE